MTIASFILLLAAACFFFAALRLEPPRVNLTAAGLFLWALSLLLGGFLIR